jgi:hypothetical protein
MDADRTVTADFTNTERFANASPFGGSMPSVQDGSCVYTVSASITSLTLDVITAANGTISGTGNSSTNITVTGNSGSCIGNPFTVASSGNLSGSGSSVNGTLTHFSQQYQSNNETITITGTRSGNTLSGSLTFQEVLRNGAGAAFPTNAMFSFTLTKQP